jgi:aldehyde:ferredoxin oxidoreductase
MFTDGAWRTSGFPEMYPVYVDGKWQCWYADDFAAKKEVFSADGVEKFKSAYYALEGWDVSSGWATRKSLENLGMKNVADVLQAKGKLGQG